jgi:hypothetical protein
MQGVSWIKRTKQICYGPLIIVSTGQGHGSGGWKFHVLCKHAHIFIWKMKPSQILTHFQIWRLVALHWLNPALHPTNAVGNKNKWDSGEYARSLMPNTRSSLMASNSNNTSKASCVNDETLAEDGAMRCHLSSRFCHCPIWPAANDPSCSLHWWASGDKTYKHHAQVMTCDYWNVNICIDFFGSFHTISDMRKLQNEIQKKCRGRFNID